MNVADVKVLIPIFGCDTYNVLEEIRERLIEEGESPLEENVDGCDHVFAPWGQYRFSAVSDGNTVTVVLWFTEPVEISPYDGRDDFDDFVVEVRTAVIAPVAAITETVAAVLDKGEGA